MRKYLLIVMLLMPVSVNAEAYFCVAEAGAAVEHGGKEGISAYTFNSSNKKYLQSNESGKWVVKEFGNDDPLYDSCVSEYFCENKDGYAGMFMRGDDGVFTATFVAIVEEKTLVSAVVKGRCSKL